MTDKITIILKNNTGSDVTVNDLGLVIPASSQVEANDLYSLHEIYESDDLQTLVDAGTIVVNDGTNDLSIADATNSISPFNNADQFAGIFHLFESSSVSITTSSSTYTEKINGTTPVVPSGKYRIMISYSWSHNDTGSDFIANIQVNSTDIGQLGDFHRQEPQDSSGTFGSTGTNQKHQMTRVYYYDLASDGTINVVLKFLSSLSGEESSMWDAIVEIVRVGD